MNSRNFLWDGGVLLLGLGILGVLVPDLFGDTLWFDPAENWAHLALGTVAMLASSTCSAEQQKNLTVLVGFAALAVGVLGLLNVGAAAPNFYGVSNFEPLDNVVHLAVGIWALYAALLGKK